MDSNLRPYFFALLVVALYIEGGMIHVIKIRNVIRLMEDFEKFLENKGAQIYNHGILAQNYRLHTLLEKPVDYKALHYQ